MAIYAIGDVQGCYAELNRLLDKINFDPAADRLWFCGDLVNRGPDSLQTLQLVKSLGESAICVLGNHDLHLLALHHGVHKIRDASGLQPILDSPLRGELMHWLQQLPLLHYDEQHKALLVHAGVYPKWGLSKARKLAREVECELRSERALTFLSEMYGNKPRSWSNKLSGYPRLRFITNAFTRMRYITPTGKLNTGVASGPRQNKRRDLTPWYQLPARMRDDVRIFFGHWSTLPVGCYGRCFALDGGCVWGGHLVALRIDFDAEEWFFVDALTTQMQTGANL